MSFFPAFKPSGITYNSSDIISTEESANGLTTISLDMSSYIQRTNPIFETPVYFRNDLNINGQIQKVPYSAAEIARVDDAQTKLSNVTYDLATDTSAITGKLDLSTASVAFADEHIPITKITNLSTTLVGIQDNLNSINANDSDISALVASDLVHDAAITANKNGVAANLLSTSEIQTELDTFVKPDIVTNSALITANKNAILANDADILLLQTTSAGHTTELAGLVAEDVALHTLVDANKLDVDTYKASNDAVVAGLQTQLTSNDTDIAALVVSDVAHDSTLATHTGRLDGLDTTTAANGLAISSNSAAILTNDADITGLTTTSAGHTTSITNLTGIQTSHGTRLVNLEGSDVVHSSDIATLQTGLATKQSTISNANKIPAAWIGTGIVGDAQLAQLYDVNITGGSVQTQLNALSSSVSVLDGLQTADLSSIPALQTDVANLKTTTNVNTTGITALVNADTLHSSQISGLVAADTVLQANIDLKENIISLTNQLDTSKIYDTGLVASLDVILSTVDANITVLSSSKQDAITALAKLPISNVDLGLSSLSHVDITSGLTAQLTAINDAISVLQGLQNGDVTSLQILSDNIDTLNLTKMDQSVYDVTIAPQITSILASISTLQGLQDGDIISFNSINASITNLTNTKQPLIDAANKLPSSLITRDDNLAYVDVTSSLSTSLLGLQSGLDTKQPLLNSTTNKLPVSNVDLTGSSLVNVDINTSLATSLSGLNTSVSALQSYDVAQAALNTGFTTDIGANAAAITTLTNYDTAQTALNNVFTADIATNAAGLVTVQTNLDNIKTKTETIDATLVYDTTTNTLTHTYNEENIFLNTLDDNNVFSLDLTIANVIDNKNYVQKIIVDALQFKGYCNTLMVNGASVEIKYRDGDAINLAPIAGYSMVQQTLELARMGGVWYCMSSVELYYNSVSNRIYDVTAPVILLVNGSGVVQHEINTVYTDAGATATDDVDGDISSNIVVTGSVNTGILGTYNLTYTVADSSGNTSSAIRIVNVVDTTNPVVLLNNASEITLNVNTSYTEYGATASDNSLEVLSVVITGTVNTATIGDYTVTYTATDSSGNVHAIGRLVHIIAVPLTLQWTNPSISIFDQVNSKGRLVGVAVESILAYTVTGHANGWMNGDFQLGVSSYNYTTRAASSLVSGTGAFTMTSIVDGYAFIDSTTGQTVTYTSFPYDATTFLYTGNTSSVGPIYWQQACTDGSTYAGEYVIFSFPFFLEASRIYWSTINSAHMALEYVLLGSADGTTYDFIRNIVTAPADFVDVPIAVGPKYRFFKLIITKTQSNRAFKAEYLKIYGDIYA